MSIYDKTTNKECKNCIAIGRAYEKAVKEREEKEAELVQLSRRYTRALRTIDYLQEK